MVNCGGKLLGSWWFVHRIVGSAGDDKLLGRFEHRGEDQGVVFYGDGNGSGLLLIEGGYVHFFDHFKPTAGDAFILRELTIA